MVKLIAEQPQVVMEAHQEVVVHLGVLSNTHKCNRAVDADGAGHLFHDQS